MNTEQELKELKSTDRWIWICGLVGMALIALFSSCSPKFTPVTDSFVKKYQEHLGEISFYTSGPILMTSDSTSREVKTKKGILYDYEGNIVEQILIPKGTPGRFVFSPKEDRIAITFNNDEEMYNMFGPNPKKKSYYTLLGEEFSKNVGKVTFNNKKYFIAAETGLVFLEANLKKIEKLKIKTTVLKGSNFKN